VTQANERNRTQSTRSAKLYLKHVYYGNLTPYFPDWNAAAGVPLLTDWCFQLVIDYGEHDLNTPLPTESQKWNCRFDPFSTYRAAFEVRTRQDPQGRIHREVRVRVPAGRSGVRVWAGADD
jgi:hypothetical protein